MIVNIFRSMYAFLRFFFSLLFLHSLYFCVPFFFSAALFRQSCRLRYAKLTAVLSRGKLIPNSVYRRNNFLYLPNDSSSSISSMELIFSLPQFVYVIYGSTLFSPQSFQCLPTKRAANYVTFETDAETRHKFQILAKRPPQNGRTSAQKEAD